MRAMLPSALVKLTDQVKMSIDAHRADLRNRTYPVEAFNPPRVAAEVIPVVTADGARLRVHAYGPVDAPVIVFLHGWTCSLEYWNAQINAFAGRYRVVAYDMRAHGESTGGFAHVTPQLLADDLEDVLAEVLLPGQRATLVGHSLGGMTLLAWAARYPERVAERANAVLLANTGAYELTEVSTMIPGFNKPLAVLGGRKLPSPLWLGKAILGTPVSLPPLPPIKWIFARQVMTLDADPVAISYGLNVVRSCPALVRARFGIMLAELALGDAASKLSVPTTILSGDRDDMTPPVHAERIAGLLYASGRLVEHKVLSSGHLGNVERYREFNAELADLLAHVAEPVRAAV
ncbi:alpha/beta fold hydrolase [Nocardia thailandica]|uniref:Alpha/beta fold hydrolase n=1 Tax=Nocardia thailandica TaxID=257275 RepID=A0ABW6PT65_9NOCA|nr:alpha/beta hydrolase [Nocardia thailandica]